jgi:RNA polymerase primary sigma factor
VEALQLSERVPRSVEEPADHDGASADTLGDRLADPGAEHAYDVVLDELELGSVRDLAEQLPDRERAVVRAHFGLGEPAQTLTGIGTALGVTAERARQIERAALARLRAALLPPPPLAEEGP